MIYFSGLPTVFHIFAHNVPVEERSRAFGYLVAFGSIGQTIAALVCIYVSNMEDKILTSIFTLIAIKEWLQNISVVGHN